MAASASHSDPDAAAPPPRPLTGGAVMGAVSRGTVAVTGALTTIFIARLLGPDGSGSFAIALTLINVLTVLATIGLEHGVAYYVSAGRWPALDALRRAQRVALVTGIAGAGLAVLVRLLVPSAFGGLSVGITALAAVALPFALWWFYASYIALAVDHYEGFVVPPAVQSTVALVGVVVLAWASDVSGAVAALLISHVVVALASGVWIRRRLRATAVAHDTQGMLRAAFSFGVRGYAANALQMLNFRLDVFILSAAATTAVVGQYAVAIGVTTVLWLLPQALSDVLFPRVAALSHSAAADALAQRAFVETKSLRHTVLVVTGATAVIAGALVLLVVPVYGGDFRPAIDMGLVMLPGVALLGVAGVLSATIVGRGHPEYSLYVTLITTPLTIALYAALIPAMEGIGAALAKSLSFAATFALLLFFYRRATGALSLGDFVPTSSEVDDLRRLPGAVRQWTANLRGA